MIYLFCIIAENESRRQQLANITIQNTYNVFLVVAPESGNLSLSSLANVTLRLSDVAGSVTSDGAGSLLRFARLISGLMDPAKAEKWLRSRGRRGGDKSGESTGYSSSDEKKKSNENVESESESSSNESASELSSDESSSESSSDESKSDSASDESKSESSSDDSEELQLLSGESAEATATTSPATSLDTTESGTTGSSELVELTTDVESGELLVPETEVTGIALESLEEAETTTLSPMGPSGGSGLRFDSPPHETRQQLQLQHHRRLRSERRWRGSAESDATSGQSASAGAEYVDLEAEGHH